MTRRRYPSDLTDKQWAEIEPLVPDAKPGGRARKADKRELVEAILYVLRAGCSSRRRRGSAERQTIYYHLRRWQGEGLWDRVQPHLVARDRERAGRAASPTAAVLDSQSVRTADQRGDHAASVPRRRSGGASAMR